MKSFDLFDSLIARRSIYPFTDERDPQMEREARELIPIRENVLKVQPDDVIISEMYLPTDWLRERIRALTGLENELYVTRDCKQTGEAWTRYRPELHTGDNWHLDVEGPRARGIATEHTAIWKPTDVEKHYLSMANDGLVELGKLIREARLATYNPDWRVLEMCQIEANFPTMLFASIGLLRWTRQHDIERLLISARDGFLWRKLLERCWDGITDAEYFYTSRICRNKPSSAYLDYAKSLIGKRRAALVDVCGTGWSLKRLVAHLSHQTDNIPPIYLFQKYESYLADDYETIAPTDPTIEISSMIPEWYSACLEAANQAPHPMIIDVGRCGSTEHEPVYIDTPFDWAGCPEIAAMTKAFEACVTAMQHYDLSALFKLSDEELKRLAMESCERLGHYAVDLAFINADKKREEAIIQQMLR